MVKISSITALGFLVLLVASPFISISRDWKDYIFIASGLAIIILSFLIRKELHKVIRVVHGIEEIKSDTYVENNPQ
jgi:FtsH-binding integral membrane protein